MIEEPYSYNIMRKKVHLLEQKYPCVQSEVIGYSVLGKEIIAIKLGRGLREIHYNAAIHANEWITSALLMKFIEDCMCESVNEKGPFQHENIPLLLQQTTLWLVPMLNPDGVELAINGVNNQHPYSNQLLEWNNGSTDFTRWKANIRGVDLNDQFPAHWGHEQSRRAVSKPGPFNYSGEAPLSEPEADAIARFTINHCFDLVIALHTQGEEIYWNYRDMEPAESSATAEKFALASGYRAVKLTDSDAGYKDWFIQEFGKLGFTVEAGLGINPLPLSQFSEMYTKVSRILLLGLQI
ncbi:MAG: peptidase [Bacilli bacterium]|jgi:g-D-glutamyl-meso-diaminopimelate peptidase|nr:peptidase [Bacilli bacterium]